MRPARLHITGGSGTGTTTLGRAIATEWSVPHADTDDYFWEPTDPPYTLKRAPEERLALMEAVFLPRPAWILSGSLVGWGDALVRRFDGVVFLALDPQLRLARLDAREARRYGDGIREGGDASEAHRLFMEWAAGYDDPSFGGRSRRQHEEWLSQLTIPVLRLDSSEPVTALLTAVQEWEPQIA
jgi:adenylate kinase family enzyme